MDVLEMGQLRVRRVVIGAEAPDKSAPTVVLLHGFGAPGDDLVALASGLGLPTGSTCLFPEAPLDLGEATGIPQYEGARAWWLIDFERMISRVPRDLPREIPDGLDAARANVVAMIDSLDAEKLFVGGFSQGAMLSLDVALHTTRPLAGVVLLSGTLIAEDVWRPRMKSRAGLRVFQSHGTDDPLLPFATAELLKDALTTAGMDVDFHSFAGGHTIPPEVLRALSVWLSSSP
ncbi:MAG TPA: dienelactone hydrolase family protein [Labilithrix sp.]